MFDLNFHISPLHGPLWPLLYSKFLGLFRYTSISTSHVYSPRDGDVGALHHDVAKFVQTFGQCILVQCPHIEFKIV